MHLLAARVVPQVLLVDEVGPDDDRLVEISDDAKRMLNLSP